MPAVDLAQFPPALQQEYLRLRRNFEAGLPARWLEIMNSDTHEKKVFALHRLAGAASSYGCVEIGALAREAEKWMKCAADDRLAPVMDRLAAAIANGEVPGGELSRLGAETSQCGHKVAAQSVSNADVRTSVQGGIDGN